MENYNSDTLVGVTIVIVFCYIVFKAASLTLNSQEISSETDGRHEETLPCQ